MTPIEYEMKMQEYVEKEVRKKLEHDENRILNTIGVVITDKQMDRLIEIRKLKKNLKPKTFKVLYDEEGYYNIYNILEDGHSLFVFKSKHREIILRNIEEITEQGEYTLTWINKNKQN